MDGHKLIGVQEKCVVQLVDRCQRPRVNGDADDLTPAPLARSLLQVQIVSKSPSLQTRPPLAIPYVQCPSPSSRDTRPSSTLSTTQLLVYQLPLQTHIKRPHGQPPLPLPLRPEVRGQPRIWIQPLHQASAIRGVLARPTSTDGGVEWRAG